MSLTRYLPTPSDRMGILWNLLSIEGSVVLEYGPAGTTHFSMSLFGELDIQQENRLFTTHMNESDVVMGDVKRLERAIVEIDKSRQPRVIFVVASSVAAVIGVDIKGVCTYMQPEVEAKLIAFDQGGFRGDYSVGCREAWTLLAKSLPEKTARQEAEEEQSACRENGRITFNLLGASLWSYRMRSDMEELKRLMKEAFGAELQTSFCTDTSVEALERAGEAAVNIVMQGTAVQAARILEKRFGTPWVYRMPYGYQQTLEWLECVAKVLKRGVEPRTAARLREKNGNAAQYRMYARMLRRDKMAATLMGEYDAVLGIGGFLEELGIQVENRICTHTLRSVEEPDKTVRTLGTEKERIDLIRSLHRQMVLADDTMLSLCAPDNTAVRIAPPVIRGAVLARHLPLAGERGADYLLEFVEEYLQTLK